MEIWAKSKRKMEWNSERNREWIERAKNNPDRVFLENFSQTRRPPRNLAIPSPNHRKNYTKPDLAGSHRNSVEPSLENGRLGMQNLWKIHHLHYSSKILSNPTLVVNFGDNLLAKQHCRDTILSPLSPFSTAYLYCRWQTSANSDQQSLRLLSLHGGSDLTKFLSDVIPAKPTEKRASILPKNWIQTAWHLYFVWSGLSYYSGYLLFSWFCVQVRLREFRVLFVS